MGALLGFAVGYVLGTRAGEQGIEKLVVAWKEIRASPEFRAVLASGAMTASSLLSRAAGHGRNALSAVLADPDKQASNSRRVA